jgi:hypothetical protein
MVGNSAANPFCSRPGDRMPSDGAYELGREDAELCETWDQRASEGGCGECCPPAVLSEAVDIRFGWRWLGEACGW